MLVGQHVDFRILLSFSRKLVVVKNKVETFFLETGFKIGLHIIHGCALYMGVHYTWVRIIHGCALYMDAHYTWVRIIHGCALYMDAHYTWVRIIHGCALYMGKYSTCTGPHWMMVSVLNGFKSV